MPKLVLAARNLSMLAAVLYAAFLVLPLESAAQTTVPVVVAGQEATTEPLLSASAAAKAGTRAPNDYSAVPITAEMATRASAILVLFIIIAVLIALRWLPAMVALPLMALGIGVFANVPLVGNDGILSTILEGKTTGEPSGAFRLYKAIIYVLFGGMFARFISDAKIAERIVKYAAEFGGEDPFFIALLMSAISILVFTATGGLPMIIMLGTVMFPILVSLGVSPVVCGSLLMLAFPVGSCLNPADWARLANLFDLSLDVVRRYFLIWAAIQVVVLIAFLVIEFLRMKRTTVTAASIFKSVGIIGLFAIAALIVYFVSTKLGAWVPALQPPIAGITSYWIKYRLPAALMVLSVLVVHAQYEYRVHKRQTVQWNLLTPILPLLFLLILGFGNAIIPAFLAAMAYGFLTTPRERGMQKLSRSIIDGVGDVAAPVVLMAGIGMLIAAATHPRVDAVLTPILARVVPTEPLPYVIFFLCAAPLALYRGPLNEFGLGIGIAKLMQNFMPPAATMGALRAVGMLQDPTTTQNIWICGYLKLDINALLFKLFFYSVALVIIGLLLSAWMFFPHGG
ncbi:MAG: hypothetical protein ACR2IE_12035 [Candidatus Sumerlaeaceae bacterium]